MAADLNMPLEIVVCPTVREPEGLAVSSRNKYLTDKQRQEATCLYESLQKCRQMIDAGTRASQEIISEMRGILSRPASAKIDYVSIVDAETLRDVDEIAGKVLAAVAVKIGDARLIDNIIIDLSEQ